MNNSQHIKNTNCLRYYTFLKILENEDLYCKICLVIIIKFTEY